jgi:hypothetical protein
MCSGLARDGRQVAPTAEKLPQLRKPLRRYAPSLGARNLAAICPLEIQGGVAATGQARPLGEPSGTPDLDFHGRKKFVEVVGDVEPNLT